MHGLRAHSDAHLHQLRNRALYRDLPATARAIKREQVRRLATTEVITQEVVP